MNKSIITNIVSLVLLMIGWFTQQSWLLMMGLFAISGALTNWLAIYMLFERIPGLVGSGVIPNQFEAFKKAIRDLMMQQFFSPENIDRFISGQGNKAQLQLTPVIEKVDLSPAFERLVTIIMDSSFGGMLKMFGGAEALNPLKEPFIDNMKASLIEMTKTPKFVELLQNEIDQPDVMEEIRTKVQTIIEARLAELTPNMVKEMVQLIIKKHLDWLVVWGGVFGGLIGLVSAFFVL